MGSFNPIHEGHLALARYAGEVLGFDDLWLILSPLNPQKEASEQWPYEERAALVRKAIAPFPYIRLVEIERYMPSPRYTWRTIQALKLLYPEYDFALLIGSDNLLKFRSWSSWQKILSMAQLYVYPRPGYPIPESLGETNGEDTLPYILCEGAPQHDISSTEIRQGLKPNALARDSKH